MNNPNGNILKYAPLESFVSPSFWHKLAEIKLDHDRLSDTPKTINGFYTNRSAKGCLLEVDYTAYNSQFKAPKYCFDAHGTIYNKNTIEQFKECDKNALLSEEGMKLVDDFKSGHIFDNINSLARFFVLSFADLKCHSYYYWFAFPCPLTPTLSLQSEVRKLKDIPEIQHFSEILKQVPIEDQTFFVLKKNDTTKLYTLKEVLTLYENADIISADEMQNYYFCFADASGYENPSWLMRTYAALIYYKCSFLVGNPVKFMGLRYDDQMHPDNSLIWEVVQSEEINLDTDEINFVGWEPNRNNKMGARVVSMKDTMDPDILSENMVSLNLKLMKWRLVPNLDLDILANTKCLLFGAGTLGCAVTRSLLAWGFKHLTFIDNGKIGYSNPVRQSLYLPSDAISQNTMKAPTAAKRAKEINPGAITAGYAMQIPMPGHTVGASLQRQTTEDLKTIKDLVQKHDVLFLLTDSRESRWLPTLLGAAYNKIVINAALGFDSYLVMRHGSCKENAVCEDFEKCLKIGDLKCIPGAELGCYFCNDVTAPGNSLRERTLDQQCTVTRPGVSNIAGSYAVELLVSLLQHPKRELAPAYYSSSGKSDAKVPEGILGILPHSIRGMLCNYENILPATQKFTQCIACSEKIIEAYREEGDTFLFKAFETAKYLEDITGISDYMDLCSEIIDYNDSDLELSDE